MLEERDEVGLKVKGKIPRALNGLFARIGSNMADTGHWFLGHGMLHGLWLEEGRAAWYCNRYGYGFAPPYLTYYVADASGG